MGWKIVVKNFANLLENIYASVFKFIKKIVSID